jgi:hypothetical protein
MIRILFLLVLNLSTEVEHSVGNPKIECLNPAPVIWREKTIAFLIGKKQFSLKSSEHLKLLQKPQSCLDRVFNFKLVSFAS